jgi:ABC-type glutathione transport system ATPase component
MSEPGLPILSAENIVVEFPSPDDPRKVRRVVDDVTLHIHQGETLGLVGESGCGKSTLSRVILGLIKPARGVVRIHGHDFHAAKGKQLRALRGAVQMVFQDPSGSLNPTMRVGEIIGEPLIIMGLPWKERVAELLDQCGLPADSARRFPHQFSGGQRQRIAIARALAPDPQLVICDEPTSALDVSVQAQILNLLSELKKLRNVAYLFITHDMGVVAHMADRIAVMQSGRIVESGDAVSIVREPTHELTRRLMA